jgi:hypothetical protein
MPTCRLFDAYTFSTDSMNALHWHCFLYYHAEKSPLCNMILGSAIVVCIGEGWHFPFPMETP